LSARDTFLRKEKAELRKGQPFSSVLRVGLRFFCTFVFVKMSKAQKPYDRRARDKKH
jgi:hypothetical protein